MIALVFAMFGGAYAASNDGKAKGSGAPKTRRLAISLALFVALFSVALGVGSASAVAPTIVSTGVSAVTTKAAVLDAEINPGGEATTYHFEYGLADCSANPCTSDPVPDANVGSGSSPVKVLREIEGLSPATTYHFRVVANNGSGPAAGPDRTFTTFAAPAPDTNCPNQAFRVGPSANLPNCRAYEMVSPVNKNGGDILATVVSSIRQSNNQSAVGGNKLTYSSSTAFGNQPSARGSNQYLATRGPSGWTTHGINAPLGKSLEEPGLSFTADIDTQFRLFSPDLSFAWMVDSNRTPLTSDAAQGFTNLYSRDNLADTYKALTTTIPTSGNFDPERFDPNVQGHSADFSHVVFSVRGALTPDADSGNGFLFAGDQLYDYSGGKLSLVSVLPDGTAAPGTSAAGTVFFNYPPSSSSGMVTNSVSADGSRIFWTHSGLGPEISGGPGQLYVRENPTQPQSSLNGSGECTEPEKACTKTVSGTLRSQFWTASADGSEAIYSTEGGGPNSSVGEDEDLKLNRFDVDAESTTPIAGEAGGVVGASDDASYVYFTSRENLATGATAGEWNLYLDHEGAKTFIATLSPEDRTGRGFTDLSTCPTGSTCSAGGIDDKRALTHVARVTPDGHHLAFMSNRSLTGYDNTDAVTGEPDMEVYLYDVDSDELNCASCNPSGVRPVGQELMSPYVVASSTTNGPTKIEAAAWLQSWVHNVYASRALSEDGNRLFFNSFDALVAADTNGAQDVYQWERQGSGTCQTPDGCVSLISTGKNPEKSEFIDATPNGDEVFFETSSSIDPRDPGLIDIYAARVNGGFPLPPSPPECVGDACQNIPPAPNDPTPASASFKGANDPTPRKARRGCTARNRQADKGKQQSQRKRAKRCKRAKRGTGR